MEAARQEILKAVKAIQKTHTEGEEFFEALDEFIIKDASPLVYLAMLQMAGEDTILVLSGGFGKEVARRIEDGGLPGYEYVLFEGGLRGDKKPKIIGKRLNIMTTASIDCKAVFLDDTIYGGKTFKKIQEYVDHNVDYIKLDKAIVVYDGCPVEREWVGSIFRYYDFFDAVPNYTFKHEDKHSI